MGRRAKRVITQDVRVKLGSVNPPQCNTGFGKFATGRQCLWQAAFDQIRVRVYRAANQFAQGSRRDAFRGRIMRDDVAVAITRLFELGFGLGFGMDLCIVVPLPGRFDRVVAVDALEFGMDDLHREAVSLDVAGHQEQGPEFEILFDCPRGVKPLQVDGPGLVADHRLKQTTLASARVHSLAIDALDLADEGGASADFEIA